MSSFTAQKLPKHIGVILVKDTKAGACEEENILGFISLTDANINDTNASILRNHLVNQLPGIPTSYMFLTNNRWPVQRSQENTLDISFLLTQSQSIYIQTTFDTNCVGIILSSGKALGFVFINHNSSLINLRARIKSQLQKTSQEVSGQYRFLDLHKWPITDEQENLLTIFNVIRNCEVFIEPHSSVKKRKIKSAENSDDIDSEKPKRPTRLDVDTKRHSLLPPSISQLQHETSSHDTLCLSSAQSNPIFISYVRAEAANHALELKNVLSDHGVGVYLDVHEIKAGVDWQDSLNQALLNCCIFIALVTDGYGCTKWSNREVKAADMNNKEIIPINFLKDWPPDCLAIQFASTHYIPWKTECDIQREIENGEADRALNTNFWDTQLINKVAEIILEKYKAFLKVPHEIPDSSEILKSVSNTSHGFSPTLSVPDAVHSKLIVISVHPNQKSEAHQLRLTLGKEKYEVWCSTDTLDFTENGGVNNFIPPVTPAAILSPSEIKTFNTNDSNSVLTNGKSNEENHQGQQVRLYDRRNVKRLSWAGSIDGASSLSQVSECSALSPDKINRLEMFKNRVKGADVVILLLSEDFMKSKMSKTQAYYCEHRKRVIPIIFENVTLTPWMTSLLDNVQIIKLDNKDNLKNKVKEYLKPASSLPYDVAQEEKMGLLVKRTMAALREPLCNCVYIAGSTKFYNPKSESICHAIGIELANIEFVALVTGGFYGVGDFVGRNFCEERQILRQEERIFHILPEKDSIKFSAKARQKDDGSFLPVPFGKTFFMGENVKERECLVARLVNICILIEGGQGASHEVEQFIWNDHIVIPIVITGGAAGGKFGVPSKIFVCPPGVSDHDWAVLSQDNVTPDEIAVAVRKIICSMHKSRVFFNKKRLQNLKKRGTNSLSLSKQNTLILNKK